MDNSSSNTTLIVCYDMYDWLCKVHTHDAGRHKTFVGILLYCSISHRPCHSIHDLRSSWLVYNLMPKKYSLLFTSLYLFNETWLPKFYIYYISQVHGNVLTYLDQATNYLSQNHDVSFLFFYCDTVSGVSLSNTIFLLVETRFSS